MFGDYYESRAVRLCSWRLNIISYSGRLVKFSACIKDGLRTDIPHTLPLIFQLVYISSHPRILQIFTSIIPTFFPNCRASIGTAFIIGSYRLRGNDRPYSESIQLEERLPQRQRDVRR